MNTIARLQRRTAGTIALWSQSIGHWMECPVPMETKLHPGTASLPSDGLFVLLPGIQDLHLEFELAGFIEQASVRHINVDMIAVDAHIGYYVRESILDRLHDDVLVPARKEGYERIWLVGASLGGLGAALYASRFEKELAGVLLLAPYLGGRSLVNEIKQAGGPSNWKPSPKVPDYLIHLWRWLEKYFSAPKRKPKLFLGFGERDKFASTNGILAEILPANQVFIGPGGHDWTTWSSLWGRFLEQFPKTATPGR